MNLQALRLREDQLRRELESTRAGLAGAVETLRAAEEADEQLAAAARHGSQPRTAYRDDTSERTKEWLEAVEAGRDAARIRERLRAEEATLLDELEKVRLDIAAVGVRRTVLPALDGIPRARPCPRQWNDMEGDGDARVCPRCRATVLNFALREGPEAEALLASAGPVTRLSRRADGTVLTSDCAHVPRYGWLLAAVGVGAGLVVLALVRGGHRVAGAASDQDYGRFGPGGTPVHVAGATRLDVHDEFNGLGGRTTTAATLERHGDFFSYELQCSFFSHDVTRSGRVPASVVDRFLKTVDGRRQSTAEAICAHTDDFPKIAVSVSTKAAKVDLSVGDCSYQWHAGGLPLVPDSAKKAYEDHHPEINAAYRSMLDAMDERGCLDQAQKQSNSPP